MLFPPNLKDSVIALQKSFLIYRFTCKCDVCYIGHTSQCLEIRINQHIPSNIWTHIPLNIQTHTAMPSSYNSTSAISRHLLASQTCACVYSPTMFTIKGTSTNELHLSILEALFIKRNTKRNCVSKSNSILNCFLITFSDHQKKAALPVPTLLAYYIYQPLHYDTRSVLKRSLIGVNSEFSFS